MTVYTFWRINLISLYKLSLRRGSTPHTVHYSRSLRAEGATVWTRFYFSQNHRFFLENPDSGKTRKLMAFLLLPVNSVTQERLLLFKPYGMTDYQIMMIMKATVIVMMMVPTMMTKEVVLYIPNFRALFLRKTFLHSQVSTTSVAVLLYWSSWYLLNSYKTLNYVVAVITILLYNLGIFINAYRNNGVADLLLFWSNNKR